MKNIAQDSFITSQIKTRFLVNQYVHVANYTVETIDGVVYIFGRARDQKELEAAVDSAARVMGVKKVISHIRVIDAPIGGSGVITSRGIPSGDIQSEKVNLLYDE